MKVMTNGPAKMGNHMLVKAVQLFGVPCTVNHFVHKEKQEADSHIFIKRDPRNEVLSWLRFQHRPITRGSYILGLREFEGKLSLIDYLAPFEPWLIDSDVLIVRFDDMLADDSQLRRIASHVGVPFLDDAFDALEGGTVTWSGKHSDYSTIWSPEVEDVWIEIGGPALLQRWGY